MDLLTSRKKGYIAVFPQKNVYIVDLPKNSWLYNGIPSFIARKLYFAIYEVILITHNEE